MPEAENDCLWCYVFLAYHMLDLGGDVAAVVDIGNESSRSNRFHKCLLHPATFATFHRRVSASPP